MKTATITSKWTLALLLALSQSSFAGPWPALETDQQKLEYGLALRAKIKPFFTGTFNYGMEWWNIASDQQKIKEAIAPLYPKELDNRPLSVLTLNQITEKEVPSARQLEQMKASLSQYVKAHPNFVTKQDFIRELETHAKALQATKPGDLLAVLIASVQIPAEIRDSVMKAPNSEKVAYLKAHLPEDLSQTAIEKNSKGRFTPEKLGSKAQALSLLDQLLEAEIAVPRLLELAVTTAELPATASRAELERSIAHFNNEQFVASQNEEHLIELMKKTLLSTTGDSQTETAKWSAALFRKTMQKLAAAESQKIQVEAPYLELIEKPREESILRSAVGNDCVHTCSFTKADHPDSRVFYLIDASNNRELGYIQTEIKASDKGDVLYLSTINGPTITPEQAEQILYLLDLHRAELKVQKVALASHNLDHFMNYGEVISYLQGKIDGKPRIQVHSKHPQIAEIIDGFLKVDYQKERENLDAVLYTPETHFGNLKSHYSQKPNQEVIKGHLNPKDVLMFALELDATARWQAPAGQYSDGERAIVAAKMNLDEYRKLRSTLQNQNHLPYEKYMEVAKAALHSAGYEADKAFINDHPHLFYDGLFASSDAVQGNLQRSTLKLASQVMKRGLWHATTGLIELGKDPQNVEIVNQSKEMEDILKWASHDLGFHSIQVRNIVTAGFAHPQLRQPEMTRELLRQVGDGHMWAPDLCLEILKMIHPNLTLTVASQYSKDSDPRVRNGAKKILQAQQKTVLGAKENKGLRKPVLESIRPGFCSRVHMQQ